jgi:hypothetical protein
MIRPCTLMSLPDAFTWRCVDYLFTEEDMLPTPSPEDAEGNGDLWAVVNELFGPLEK